MGRTVYYDHNGNLIGPPKSDKLLDPRPLHLKRCCGEMPVVHQFSGLGCFAIECRANGHIHNTGLWDSLEEACEAWNRRKADGQQAR